MKKNKKIFFCGLNIWKVLYQKIKKRNEMLNKKKKYGLILMNKD